MRTFGNFCGQYGTQDVCHKRMFQRGTREYQKYNANTGRGYAYGAFVKCCWNSVDGQCQSTDDDDNATRTNFVISPQLNPTHYCMSTDCNATFGTWERHDITDPPYPSYNSYDSINAKWYESCTPQTVSDCGANFCTFTSMDPALPPPLSPSPAPPG